MIELIVSKYLILIVFILKMYIYFINITKCINISVSSNPLQFPHESQFGKPWFSISKSVKWSNVFCPTLIYYDNCSSDQTTLVSVAPLIFRRTFESLWFDPLLLSNKASFIKHEQNESPSPLWWWISLSLSLSAACFLESWRRCSRRGGCAALNAVERTSPTASSAPLSSCASCVRRSCPRPCSIWRRSIRPNAPREPSRSSPRWCRAWPAFQSQSLESSVIQRVHHQLWSVSHPSHDTHGHAHSRFHSHLGVGTSVILL